MVCTGLLGAAITKAYRLNDSNRNLFPHSSRLRFKPTQFLVKALLASADCQLCPFLSVCACACIRKGWGELSAAFSSSYKDISLIRSIRVGPHSYICLYLIIFLKALFLNTLGARTSNIWMWGRHNSIYKMFEGCALNQVESCKPRCGQM